MTQDTCPICHAPLVTQQWTVGDRSIAYERCVRSCGYATRSTQYLTSGPHGPRKQHPEKMLREAP